MPIHTDEAGWPIKTREIRNHHMDSRIWNDLAFRDGDVVIGTYGKSGTTWVQQIVGQLIFQGDPEIPVADMSPWLDLRVPPASVKLPAVEAQQHRRFLKTHLPVDALVWSPKAKYLYIGRDGRDVMWSLHNHFFNGNELLYQLLNDTPDRVGPPIERPGPDPREWFLHWLENDGAPFWPFWENIRSWWDVRGLPNLMLLHFAELKRDLPGSIRRIADFLEIGIDEARFPAIVEHCSFAWMKANGSKAVPLGGALWDGGAETFVHRGVNGRWRDSLNAAECRSYESLAREKLGEACAHWLATGEMEMPEAMPVEVPLPRAA
ncbi:sulfotransferase domain-containing protein [Falsiroseomonas sp. HW251]|uniref:sulfotransferase domain-containing protein n=1 Tax=Falsiroseomonas sp. HW251 TaxID=3390998 RepID=UPI003D320956